MDGYSKEELIQRFHLTRQSSVEMCSPLIPEQCRIQPIADVSPPWWNLAHTSWFFTRNVLQPFKGKSCEEDSLFDYVLNSYYASLGPRLERNRRGLMTRPTMQEVLAYRKSVDSRVDDLVRSLPEDQFQKCAPIMEIGIQHEQQHQELFYTEIKFILYQNPLKLRVPYLKNKKEEPKRNGLKEEYFRFEEGLFEFGNLEGGWGWDNEYPVHKYLLNAFSLLNRLVTNREYLEFMEEGGYEKQLLWLDNGWSKKQEGEWTAPLYWEKIDGEWQLWTLSGMQKLNPDDPVCHVSFYEAEAFSTWKGARLPSEREWELAARTFQADPGSGNFLDSGLLHPAPPRENSGLRQMFGDLWEWTSSYFEPYTGYIPFKGALSEYNEKFMDNQRVMRGGSCVSERNHIRASYRNFWPPETRFQFTGIRLAKNEEN